MKEANTYATIFFNETNPMVSSDKTQNAIIISDRGGNAVCINPDTAFEALCIVVKEKFKFDNIERYKADEIIEHLKGIFEA